MPVLTYSWELMLILLPIPCSKIINMTPSSLLYYGVICSNAAITSVKFCLCKHKALRDNYLKVLDGGERPANICQEKKIFDDLNHPYLTFYGKAKPLE